MTLKDCPWPRCGLSRLGINLVIGLYFDLIRRRSRFKNHCGGSYWAVDRDWLRPGDGQARRLFPLALRRNPVGIRLTADSMIGVELERRVLPSSHVPR